MPTDVEVLAKDPEIAPLLKPNYLRYHQRKEWSDEVEGTERRLADPYLRKSIANAGRLKVQNDRQRALLKDQTPPPLTASQRDKIARLNAASLALAKEGMLSQEEMRHKPPGAGDRLKAYDKAKKPIVLLWKKTQILLHPDNDERDLCNIEKYRPARPTVDLVANAQLPAVHAMSAQAKENWPLGEGGFTEAERKELDAKGSLVRGGYEIRKVRARKLREPKEYKTFECKHPGCDRGGRPFIGSFAKAQYAKHIKHAHGGIEAAA